jgi:hypothetical protein
MKVHTRRKPEGCRHAPSTFIESVARGTDMFDCMILSTRVIPASCKDAP